MKLADYLIAGVLLSSLPSWERGLKLSCRLQISVGFSVAPLVGAWIEIRPYYMQYLCILVAPLVGAWIEITRIWVDGPAEQVAPLVGAWIEINPVNEKYSSYKVAPLVGAWIEIDWTILRMYARPVSLPSWERGLKYE